MKQSILGLILLTAAAASGEGYHTFTDPQGRSLEARIISLDEASGKVELERQDGKTFKVPPNAFSEADQVYIRQWISANQILSEKNLRISFRKKSEPVDEKVTPQKPGFDGEAVQYELILDNRTKESIEKLQIEYRYFITVDYRDSNRDEYVRPVSGKITVEHIDPSSSVIVLTEPATFGERIRNVAVYDSTTRRLTGYDEKTVSDEDLEGIWLKIHGPEIDGVAMLRDACYPEGLMKKMEWDTSISRGKEQALKRGLAMSAMEFSEWICESVLGINESLDEAGAREISDFTEGFYEDHYDPSGDSAMLIAVAYYFRGMYDLSVHWLEKEHEQRRFPWFADELLAELYSSAPGVCDGQKAVRQAEQIVAVNKRNPNAWELSILASAYARDGQYGKAVETQERALAALGSKKRKEYYQETFQRRLELFKAGKPYDLDPSDPLCWYCNIHIRKKSATGRADGQFGEYESLWPQEDYRKVPYFSRSWHEWQI